MTYSARLSEITGKIIIQFENYHIRYQQIDYGGPIHSFFVTPPDEAALNNDWEPIVASIAGSFQINLAEEYETWNIYIFFVFKAKVDPKLKYKIENDTFSSRKILIESEMSDEEIIVKHILNTNLELLDHSAQTEPETFEYNEAIQSVLSGKNLKNKKRTAEAEPAFDALVEILKKSVK
jgi:hypothetical protein